MRYCSHCGKQIADEAVICVNCGCAVNSNHGSSYVFSSIGQQDADYLLNQLSSKLKTNGIIWLVIGIVQILIGLFVNEFVLIVGILNIISSVQDISYSTSVLKEPKDIIKRFTPLTGPIITLVYNVVIGGIIGVIGSVYYFVAIRGFVTEHKNEFEAIENGR